MKTRKINTYILFTVVFQKGRFEKKITTSNYKIYNCKSIKSLHIYLIFAKKKKKWLAGWLAGQKHFKKPQYFLHPSGCFKYK